MKENRSAAPCSNKKVNIVYYHDEGFILYERGDISIECILRRYDDIIRLVNFEEGLLTVLMKKEDREVEEYVDFEAALQDIQLSREKDHYFKGITLEDMALERDRVR